MMLAESDGAFVDYEDYKTLQSALQVAQQELKTAQHTGSGEKVMEAYKERAEKAGASNKRLVELLRRYRNEIPLGHQPHMIAHVVDELLREAGK